MHIYAQAAQPYDHDEKNVWDACHITEQSYDQFCREFRAIVTPVVEREPEKRSCEIEAWEKLIMQTVSPRELAYYITQILRENVELGYLRKTLRRLLSDPAEERRTLKTIGSA